MFLEILYVLILTGILPGFLFGLWLESLRS